MYRDNKFPEDYIKNTLIKGVGLVSVAMGSGLALRQMFDKDNKEYFEEYYKNSPR